MCSNPGLQRDAHLRLPWWHSVVLLGLRKWLWERKTKAMFENMKCEDRFAYVGSALSLTSEWICICR